MPIDMIPAGLAYSILGWISALVLNYLSDVLPRNRGLGKPVCTYCEARLNWLDYIVLSRRCQTCGHTRHPRHLLVIIGYIAIAFWLGNRNQFQVSFWMDWLILCFFGIVVVIDVEHRLILNPVSMAGVALGLLYGTLLHGITATLLGGIAGFFAMLVLYRLGEIFANWISRRRGEPLDEVALGFGDVNLAGILGLILGWPGIVAGLFFTILFGGMGGFLSLMWMKLRRSYQVFTPIPYGPYFILAAIYLLYLRA